jgi:hypothetical protein
MSALDLRPLSLGELLDRTFLLYRRNFLLFTGIAAIPYSMLLVVSLGSILFDTKMILPQFPPSAAPVAPAAAFSGMITGILVVSIVGTVAFLYSAAASVLAVSEIYLGRSASIVGSLKSATRRFFPLLGVVVLTSLITIGGLILLIIPAFCFMCRMSVAIASTVLEDVGPGTAIGRSFELTKGFAGRAFMIFLLYFALAFAVGGAVGFPFGILILVYAKQPAMLTLWMGMNQVASFFVRVLVAPIGTISISLYYYDLRVRKEAFDLQMMMQGIGEVPLPPPVTGGVPSMFGRDAS